MKPVYIFCLPLVKKVNKAHQAHQDNEESQANKAQPAPKGNKDHQDPLVHLEALEREGRLDSVVNQENLDQLAQGVREENQAPRVQEVNQVAQDLQVHLVIVVNLARGVRQGREVNRDFKVPVVKVDQGVSLGHQDLLAHLGPLDHRAYQAQEVNLDQVEHQAEMAHQVTVLNSLMSW